MLCVCLGNPPEKFDWQTRDKKKKFIRLTDLNPIDFYKRLTKKDGDDSVKEIVKKEYMFVDMICLKIIHVHDIMLFLLIIWTLFINNTP